MSLNYRLVVEVAKSVAQDLTQLRSYGGVALECSRYLAWDEVAVISSSVVLLKLTM